MAAEISSGGALRCPHCNSTNISVYRDGSGICNMCDLSFSNAKGSDFPSSKQIKMDSSSGQLNQDREMPRWLTEDKKDAEKEAAAMRGVNKKPFWYYTMWVSGFMLIVFYAITIFTMYFPPPIPTVDISDINDYNEQLRTLRAFICLVWMGFLFSIMMVISDFFD